MMNQNGHRIRGLVSQSKTNGYEMELQSYSLLLSRIIRPVRVRLFPKRVQGPVVTVLA